MSQGHHINSRRTYHEEGEFSQRAMQVLALYRESPQSAMTDREVMNELGFSDMNAVRPRITELIQAGQLIEVGETPCPMTRKRVRLVRLASKYAQHVQQEMAL